MSKFQVIVLTIFGFLTVIGIAIFAISKAGQGESRTATVVWGTMAGKDFSNWNTKIRENIDDKVSITYVEKSKTDFVTDLVEAIASGIGPDAIIFTDDLLLRLKDKIYPIPFTSITERQFRDTYIDSASILLKRNATTNSPAGIYALPLISDPIVMYWNRDLLSASGISSAPKDWDEFSNMAKKLTVKTPENDIITASVPFGSWKNIENAKAIIAMLMLQAGTPIVSENSMGNYESALKNQSQNSSSVSLPAESALRFFTDFSNPLKPSYSWNRAMQEAQKVFVSGGSAFYFGFASELQEIKDKNPNLNFDIAVVPQIKNVNTFATYGAIYSIGIIKASTNYTNTFANISALTSAPSLSYLSNILILPIPRRDILAIASQNPFLEIFNKSTIFSKTWADPDPLKSNIVFQNMIESITSGKSTVSESLMRADSELASLLVQ